jgi:nucleotide-binding universal stress UspA family protein
MTYATVMVCLTLERSNQAVLEVAGELAERFGAGIVGTAASHFSPPLYFTTGGQAQSLIDQGLASIKKRIAELEGQFREAIKNRARFVEWRSAIDLPARYILQQTRCADIVVTGRQVNGFADPFVQASPKDLVMQAARPLLVVPEKMSSLDLKSILVAWKDTPEARRAVSDALPLLRKAKEITIAETVENGDSRQAALSRVQDVVAWLSHHGISASEIVREENGERDMTVHLEAIASDVNASMIVAGAYGHSRFRELVLGGVTQHLITESNRCVLLSH